MRKRNRFASPLPDCAPLIPFSHKFTNKWQKIKWKLYCSILASKSITWQMYAKLQNFLSDNSECKTQIHNSKWYKNIWLNQLKHIFKHEMATIELLFLLYVAITVSTMKRLLPHGSWIQMELASNSTLEREKRKYTYISFAFSFWIAFRKKVQIASEIWVFQRILCTHLFCGRYWILNVLGKCYFFLKSCV